MMQWGNGMIYWEGTNKDEKNTETESRCMNDSAGKFGRDQLNQAADDEKRRMKQAEQA